MHPDVVHVDDGGLRRRGVLYAGVGAAFAVLATVSAMLFADATLADLAWFSGVLLGACACWLAAHVVASGRRRRRERREIAAFFDGTIWEHWTYSPDDWRTIVDRDQPVDPPLAEWNWNDHLVTFGGLGVVLATVVVLVGVFGFDDPDVTPIVFAIAGTLVFVMVGAAVAQPFYLRRIHRERRASLQALSEPGVWFGPHAVYHDALGFVRLEPLARVHDDTAHRHPAAGPLRRTGQPTATQPVMRGAGSVVFTIARRAEHLGDVRAVPARVVHVDVPGDARDRASALVEHYHRGRPELAD